VVDLGDDLTPPLRRLLEDAGARRAQVERGLAYVTRHAGPVDGQSALRMRALIGELL
jgi:hypothetical protein